MKKFVGFLASGLPGICIAIGFNFLLVRYAEIPKVIAYGPVLLIQSLINYAICRRAVFAEESIHHPFWNHFFQFLGGSLVFRLLDWALYGVTTSAGLHYLVAQGLNVVLFSILRFRYTKTLFERRPAILNPTGAGPAPSSMESGSAGPQ